MDLADCYLELLCETSLRLSVAGATNRHWAAVSSLTFQCWTTALDLLFTWGGFSSIQTRLWVPWIVCEKPNPVLPACVSLNHVHGWELQSPTREVRKVEFIEEQGTFLFHWLPIWRIVIGNNSVWIVAVAVTSHWSYSYIASASWTVYIVSSNRPKYILLPLRTN